MTKEPRSFREWWALHALRYGLILAGVFAWLWDAPAVEGVLVGSLLLSLLLLLELPLYGPGHERGHPAWGVLQTVAGVAAMYITPGLPAALILCAVISGVAAIIPWLWSITFLVAMSGVTVMALMAAHDVNASLGLISLYTLSVWLGRLFAMRLEDNGKHRQTVAAAVLAARNQSPDIAVLDVH